MGTRRRPVNMEGATTHSRLRAAVSEWVSTNGRAIATLLRLSSVVVCDVMYCG